MLRKISLALVTTAAAMALSAVANAQLAPFPSAANESGPEPGETPTMSYERPAPSGGIAGGAESCFPSQASECGPAIGEAPTTMRERAVGATGVGAGGVVGAEEVQTAIHPSGLLDD